MCVSFLICPLILLLRCILTYFCMIWLVSRFCVVVNQHWLHVCLSPSQGQVVKSEGWVSTPAAVIAAQSRTREQVGSVGDVDGEKGPRGTSCPLKDLWPACDKVTGPYLCKYTFTKKMHIPQIHLKYDLTPSLWFCFNLNHISWSYTESRKICFLKIIMFKCTAGIIYSLWLHV